MNDYSNLAGQMLGGVGDVDIRPRYVGDVSIQPRYVGAPAEMVQSQGPLGKPVQYSPAEYVAGNVTWFGLGRTVITAGATGQVVSIKPLRPITPQKIFCPSTNQGLLLAQASIGGTNIFANQAGVPIELFSEVSTAPQIEWPTIDTSVGIDFTLINPTLADIVFTGALYGTAVRR
ncbi:MAG TPA: hypothetical protein VK192_06005 [Sphingomicrobium sp.]|nr:hypothetical protein [Sphingomicrobium sp.]